MTLTPSPADGLGVGAMPGTTDDCWPASARRNTQWLNHAAGARGCSHPVRLSGEITDIDPATGELVRRAATGTMPDSVLYMPCGTRRASICPACAETYRRDAYQIVKAGLDGGKGIPADVAAHPAIFATFTAPSFGLVHTRVTGPGGKMLRCRPRRKKAVCPHGRHLSCPHRHKETDASLGKPLCPDCYDYDAAVVWNAHAPELWRRTMIGLRRRLDRLARPAPDQAVLRQGRRIPGTRSHPLPCPAPARRLRPRRA